MLTANKNLLSLVGFKVSFDNPEITNISYFATSATFPSVSAQAVQSGYRNRAGYVCGEKLEYDPVTLRIAVDEDLKVYDEIYTWMLNNTRDDLKTYNFTLSFLTSHNNVSRNVRFIRAFPTSIGGLDFNVQNSDTEYAYLDVTFQYDYFEFV